MSARARRRCRRGSSKVASAASIGAHLFWSEISATSKKRRKIASAAALVAVAMKAVIGVGAPS